MVKPKIKQIKQKKKRKATREPNKQKEAQLQAQETQPQAQKIDTPQIQSQTEKTQQTEEAQKITLSEEELYEKTEDKEEALQLVVFRLATEWYGIDIMKVKEVIKVELITYLPASPEHIAGIVNLRGSILSVTDMRKIFGLPLEQINDKSRLVVIELGALETGILVDEVIETMVVPLSKIDPVLTTIAQGNSDYIAGETKLGDKLIGILNAENVFKK
ncbi:MAG: chemotaxis protein CheW [Candidatus Omnitrophota bacterium]